MTQEKRSRTLLWIVIGGGAFFLFVLAVFALVYLTLHAGKDTTIAFGDKIGVVDLDGVIFSPNPVVQQLKKFGDDDSIKAIILHVNADCQQTAPGGNVRAVFFRPFGKLGIVGFLPIFVKRFAKGGICPDLE